MTKVENFKKEMLSYFEEGKRACTTLGIGSEWEFFLYNKKDGSNITFEGENGLESVLFSLYQSNLDNYKKIEENGNLIGLQGKYGSISIEPGLQLEFSSSIRQNLHDIYDDNKNFMTNLRTIVASKDLEVFFSGFHPFLTPEKTEIVPKKRYDIMYNYMPKVGSLGRYMMKNTTTTQTNVSYSSQEHMSDILMLFSKISPVITSLFANSKIVDGKVSNYQSFRSHIWQHTDNARSGIKEFIFKKDKITFEDYINFALTVPMYFIVRDGNYIDLTGKSFIDFINKDIKELNDTLGDYEVTKDDFVLHLSCIFPEVRLKNYLEIRSADSGSLNYVVALSAFVAGIAYSQNALQEANKLIKDWSYGETQELLKAVPTLGLKTKIKDKELSYYNNIFLEMAEAGLKERNAIVEGECETKYLDVLKQVSKEGVTQASKQELLFNESNTKLDYLKKLG